MKMAPPIRCLLLDIGGVLLSDGWDRAARRRAAEHFGFTPLEAARIEARHEILFETFELGKLTLDEYFERTVFEASRAFTRHDFRSFMFEQSTPHTPMLELCARLKTRHALKVVVVNNEARELNAYRIARFGLGGLADAFVSSCFVHLRKPDPAIFQLALDVAQVPAERVLYIDDVPIFVDIASTLGIRGICHTDAAVTGAQLAALGLDGAGARVRARRAEPLGTQSGGTRT
jgi:putative hydrolase of the HAD superfamily